MPQCTADIIRVLPGLRRYACALTGSTRSGDEYIRVTLETLVEEPWRLPPRSAVRPELYALLHRTLRVCRFQDSDVAEISEHRADVRHRLRQLPLVDRELVLLIDLEGFVLDDAAELLGLSESDAKWRLAGARRALQAPRRDDARASPPPPSLGRCRQSPDATSAGWLHDHAMSR